MNTQTRPVDTGSKAEFIPQHIVPSCCPDKALCGTLCTGTVTGKTYSDKPTGDCAVCADLLAHHPRACPYCGTSMIAGD